MMHPKYKIGQMTLRLYVEFEVRRTIDQAKIVKVRDFINAYSRLARLERFLKTAQHKHPSIASRLSTVRGFVLLA